MSDIASGLKSSTEGMYDFTEMFVKALKEAPHGTLPERSEWAFKTYPELREAHKRLIEENDKLLAKLKAWGPNP